MKEINSLNNETIKLVNSLKEAKNRKKLGLFLVDGKRETFLAMKARKRIIHLFFCEEKSKIKEEEKEVLFQEIKNNGGEIILINEKVLEKISFKESPEEMVSVFKADKLELKDLKEEDKSLLVILEGIEKPGNIGAIIRTAYAAGIKNIILNNCPTDIYNPNTIRASEGLIFFVNLIKESPENTIKFLHDNEIKIFAAETKAKTIYSEANFKERSAILLGSEARGLSEFWLEKASERIKIPMKTGVDSLNISVSAAILIYEVIKQRGFKGL